MVVDTDEGVAEVGVGERIVIVVGPVVGVVGEEVGCGVWQLGRGVVGLEGPSPVCKATVNKSKCQQLPY